MCYIKFVYFSITVQTSKNEPKKVTAKFKKMKKNIQNTCYKILLKKILKKLFLTLKAKKQTIFILWYFYIYCCVNDECMTLHLYFIICKIFFSFCFLCLNSVLDYTMVWSLGLLSTKMTFVILLTISEGCVIVSVLGH